VTRKSVKHTSYMHTHCIINVLLLFLLHILFIVNECFIDGGLFTNYVDQKWDFWTLTPLTKCLYKELFFFERVRSSSLLLDVIGEHHLCCICHEIVCWIYDWTQYILYSCRNEINYTNRWKYFSLEEKAIKLKK